MGNSITSQENVFLGFTPDEIVKLYKFLYAFEKVESYKSYERFKQDYPVLSASLYEVFKSLDLRAENHVSIIQEIDKVRYTDAHRQKYMAFLYHLRNSIAHGYIRKGEDIEIKDLWQGSFSASGHISPNKSTLINN